MGAPHLLFSSFPPPSPFPSEQIVWKAEQRNLAQRKMVISMQNRDTIYSDTKRTLDFLNLLRGSKNIPFILIKSQYLNNREDCQILQHRGPMSRMTAGLGTMTLGRITDAFQVLQLQSCTISNLGALRPLSGEEFGASCSKARAESTRGLPGAQDLPDPHLPACRKQAGSLEITDSEAELPEKLENSEGSHAYVLVKGYKIM